MNHPLDCRLLQPSETPKGADDEHYPPNVVMAVLLGAFLLHGVQPGPLLIKEDPEIFWGVIASMYIGNAMLLVLNLPLIRLWVQLLRVPQEDIS